MACPSKPAARRAPSSTWSGTGPDAPTRRRPVPRYKQGASHDTGTQTLPGHGAAAALAAALAPLGSRAAQPAAASFPYALSDAQWRERLSREEYEVLRREATERPYSSPLNNEHRKGLYTCAGCAQCSRRTASSTAAPAGPASGSPAGRRGRDRGPHLRHGPHGGALRQLRRPSGTRVRRRPAPDRPALLHERRRAALHGAELRHAPPHPQTIGSIAMPASFLSRKLPGLLTAACALAATLPGIAASAETAVLIRLPRKTRPPASRRKRPCWPAAALGRAGRVPARQGRQLGRLRLRGRTGVHRQLRHGERRPQRPRRSRGDHLRPGPGQLRPAAADLFLGGARPDPAQPPGRTPAPSTAQPCSPPATASARWPRPTSRN